MAGQGPHPSVTRLWADYGAANPDAPVDLPPHFHFCDNAADADICARLVVEGRKRATATSLAELQLSGDPLPRVGDHAIITDWMGSARAIIRTSDVAIRRLGDIDADFARLEGEGDLSLIWWRRAHDAYYRRVLAGSDSIVDDDLEIACETFELLFIAP